MRHVFLVMALGYLAALSLKDQKDAKYLQVQLLDRKIELQMLKAIAKEVLEKE